jgi:hypothetical protein
MRGRISREGLLTSPAGHLRVGVGRQRLWPSQRSLHNAPIFRLLLKVAVNGTHQCDFLNFCGGLGPQRMDNWAGGVRPWVGAWCAGAVNRVTLQAPPL